MDLRYEIRSADLTRISKKFDKLDQKIKDRIEKAINITALNIQADAQTNTPVVTNRLRSSIHIETAQKQGHIYSDNKGKSFDGKLKLSLPKYAAAVGTNVEYAMSVEHNNRSKGFHFMLNASKMEQPKFNKRIKEILKDAV